MEQIKESLYRTFTTVRLTRFLLTLDKKGVMFNVRTPEHKLRIRMFFTIAKRRKDPLYAMVEQYMSTRRGLYGVFSTNDQQKKHLMNFLKITGVKCVEEIDDGAVTDYINAIKETAKTSLEKLSAATALKGFMRYLDRKEKEKRPGKIGRPEKYERNLEMVALRKFDATYYTMDRLAEKFNITKRAVWEILKRYERKDSFEASIDNKSEDVS